MYRREEKYDLASKNKDLKILSLRESVERTYKDKGLLICCLVGPTGRAKSWKWNKKSIHISEKYYLRKFWTK